MAEIENKILLSQTKNYYDTSYSDGSYNIREKERMTDEARYINERIGMYGAKTCLEVGSGGGALQDIVDDYTGLDITDAVKHLYHKPFVQGSATEMPFEDNTFDMEWSIATIEHIPEPELVFDEMIRTCKAGGHLLLSPAWHCRRWRAQGYEVRPYSDFGFGGKVYKFMIPFLDNILVRAIQMVPFRLYGSVVYIITKKRRRMPFIYSKLDPQYEIHRIADDDACNAMDPYLAILYFISRGHRCVSHKNFFERITSTHGFIDIEIVK